MFPGSMNKMARMAAIQCLMKLQVFVDAVILPVGFFVFNLLILLGCLKQGIARNRFFPLTNPIFLFPFFFENAFNCFLNVGKTPRIWLSMDRVVCYKVDKKIIKEFAPL